MNTGRTSNEFNSEGTAGTIRKLRRHKLILVLIFLVLFIAAELFRSNFMIDCEDFTYLSKQVPVGFDGVKIAQISDYHNHGGGLDDRIIDKLKLERPDYIFITGDTVDSIRTDLDKAKNFLEKVAKIAPCYMVWGNHEMELKISQREEMAAFCKEKGITLLNNECVEIERNGSKMLLAGTSNDIDSSSVEEFFATMPEQKKFVVWLHHYPEDFEEIVKKSEKKGSRCDLMFAGHAHGGLIGVPFAGGLYAPGQGIFPKYIDGKYDNGESAMIVSRGVGNSGYTMRFFNSFHLVFCTLKTANK